MNIFFKVEANPVQMRCQCFYSAVMGNSKLDYLLLLREVVKRLALQQSLWLNPNAFGTMDLIAQHIHTLALLPVHLTHEGLRVFKGIPR